MSCKKVGLSYLTQAKHRFYAVEVIKATPDQIFDAFEDPYSWTVWATPIQNVEWTSPKPFQLGTTRTVSMSGGIVGYEEFIAWERGKQYGILFYRYEPEFDRVLCRRLSSN